MTSMTPDMVITPAAERNCPLAGIKYQSKLDINNILTLSWQADNGIHTKHQYPTNYHKHSQMTGFHRKQNYSTRSCLLAKFM